MKHKTSITSTGALTKHGRHPEHSGRERSMSEYKVREWNFKNEILTAHGPQVRVNGCGCPKFECP